MQIAGIYTRYPRFRQDTGYGMQAGNPAGFSVITNEGHPAQPILQLRITSKVSLFNHSTSYDLI